MKQRESRQKVMLRARMLSGASWHDVCILNVSAHGLGIQSAKAPQRGSYVEIRKGKQTIIARVAWSNGHRSGLRSQDPIFISALVAGSDPETPRAVTPSGRLEERRRQVRTTGSAHDDSRLAGRAMEFASLALFAGAIGLAAAGTIGDALAQPMAAVEHALDRS